MPAIAIRSFGGIMPSVRPRALPNDAAQVADNLDMRFGDFRPTKVAGAAVTSVTAGTLSVYRAPSGTWRSSTLDADFVLGQVHDTPDERVYITGRAAYPEVWKTGDGAARQLGVPAPTAAPDVSVAVTEEFTTDEYVTAKTGMPETLKGMFDAALQKVNRGNAPSGTPSPSTPGWLAHGALGSLPTTSALQWAFLVPMVAGGGGYVMSDPAAHNFLLAPELGGKQVTYSANEYWAVPAYFQGQGYTIDSAGLTTALKTVMNPSDGVTRLWTDPEVDAIVASVVARYNVANEPYASLVEAINAAQNDLSSVYNSVLANAYAVDTMEAFFDSAAVAAQLSDLLGTSTGAMALEAYNAGAYSRKVYQYAYQFATSTPMDTADSGPPTPASTTRYFDNASQATPATNIRADFSGFIVQDSRGADVIDRLKLESRLREEFYDLINQRSPELRWKPADVDEAIYQCYIVAAAVYSDANWTKSATWPLNAGSRGSGVDAANVSAMASARDRLRSACEALGVAYEGVNSEYRAYIEDKMFDIDILPKLPPVVDRILEPRSYIYTYVNDWGEESAPSPPTDVFDCDQNDVVTLVGAIPPAGRYVRKMRLYRSSTSNTGSAFQFVVENVAPVEDVDWPTLVNRTYVDSTRQEDLQEPCPTLSWAEPPAALKGLTVLPNGIMVGFVGSRLYFCEPYVPYAWPPEYQQTTEFAIVGIGAFGQTAVVLTTGNPYYASGADSASISVQKLESNQACVSKRSIASCDGGVLYASPDGVCLAGPSGVRVVTEGAYSRSDWQALSPASSFARFHEGVYYIFLTVPGICLAVDLRSSRISTMTIGATAAYSDLLTDTLYAVSGTSVLPLFQGAAMTGTWRSKVVVGDRHVGFTCLKVESDFTAAVTVKMYGDGVLVHTATASSRAPQRLPAGRYREIEVEVTTSANVTGVVLATSMSELAEI